MKKSKRTIAAIGKLTTKAEKKMKLTLQKSKYYKLLYHISHAALKTCAEFQFVVGAKYGMILITFTFLRRACENFTVKHNSINIVLAPKLLYNSI